MEMMARPASDASRLDLSGLAQSSVRAEQIYPGDVLEVTIATGVEEKAPTPWKLRVADNGVVEIPLVGQVQVAGMLLLDAEQVIRRESINRKIYRDPHIAVLLHSHRTIGVTVVGAVQKPGTYKLPMGDADLLHALLAAGNLTDNASTIVEIRTLGPPPGSPAPQFQNQPVQNRAVRIDLQQATRGMMSDLRIQDGAVVMVMEQTPKTVQVIGLVKRPDRHEIEPGRELRLLDAIALGGGRTTQLADKVYVVRNLEGSPKPILIEASVSKAKQGGSENLLLAPGDVVSVEETPLTFTVGTIQNFIRFGFSAAIPGL